MPNPIHAAHEIFSESLGSLMAHSIRGTQNYFRRHMLDLELLIVADTYGVIQLRDPRNGATSILQTRLIKARVGSGVRDTVKARIYIHKDANRVLARICVAHEIFHLLKELAEYSKNHRTAWNAVTPTPETEDQCNQFAWELCSKHDKFNKSDGVREKLIYFPDHLFDKPLNTNATRQNDWPLGMSLDSASPFHKRPIIP